MKTSASLIIMSVVCLALGSVVGYVFSDARQETECDNCQKALNNTNSEVSLKEVELPIASAIGTAPLVTFKVPDRWNVFYNGDASFVTDPNQVYAYDSITLAVSSPDRPVSLSDVNWQQIDFRVTAHDLITTEFIASQQDISRQTVEPITLGDFSGYKITDKPESDIPTKENPESSTYYLRPLRGGSDWGLIITKESKGDSSFEEGAASIIASIELSS